MVLLGLTRWFVDHFRQQQRGGRTMYELALVPQAITYKIARIVHHGLQNHIQEQSIQPKDLVVTAWLNTREVTAKDELRLGKSLCAELAGEAMGEGMRLGLFDAVGIDKYARQLLIEENLQRSLQRPPEEIQQVDEIDLANEMRLDIEAARALRLQVALAETRASTVLMERVRKAIKKSLDLLYSNLPEEQLAEAKSEQTITVKRGGERFVIPVKKHGLVERFDKSGKHMGSYCLVFSDDELPLGDEVLMKLILIKSDLRTFLNTANFMSPKRHWA